MPTPDNSKGGADIPHFFDMFTAFINPYVSTQTQI